MLYMVTFIINIPPMLAYIPYMDPMGSPSPSWALLVRQDEELAELVRLGWREAQALDGQALSHEPRRLKSLGPGGLGPTP